MFLLHLSSPMALVDTGANGRWKTLWSSSIISMQIVVARRWCVSERLQIRHVFTEREREREQGILVRGHQVTSSRATLDGHYFDAWDAMAEAESALYDNWASSMAALLGRINRRRLSLFLLLCKGHSRFRVSLSLSLIGAGCQFHSRWSPFLLEAQPICHSTTAHTQGANSLQLWHVAV